MKNQQTQSAPFDPSESVKVIREMIKLSRKQMTNNGILFILWGWLLVANNLGAFLESKLELSYQLKTISSYFMTIVFGILILYTIYYLVKQNKKVKTYVGVSLRYVWFSMIACLVLINVIQSNVLHTINFQLQHPIFMVIFAFAITVTGGILKDDKIISGGIIFGFLAVISSYFSIENQLLFEAIAWFIAFVIPGHFLYAQRKRLKHV